MRRIAALVSIILGLSMVLALPAVMNAAPAAAETASECAAKGWTFTGTSCIAPVVTTTPATTSTAPTAPICNAPSYYEASTNSCKTPTSLPTNSGGSTSSGSTPCPALTTWDGKSCVSTMGGSSGGASSGGDGSGSGLSCTNGWVPNPSYTSCIAPVVDGTGPSGSASGSASGSSSGSSSGGSNVGGVGSGATGSGGSTGGNTMTIKCADGSYRNTAIECPGSTSVNTGATTGGVTTGSSMGTSDEQKAKCASVGWTWTGNSCIAPVVSGGSAVSTCPSGSYFDFQAGGCKSATAQSATIKCADGTFKVTALECASFGGAVGSAVAAATGSTCANGYAPNSTGFCVPIASISTSNAATSCPALTTWDGTKCVSTMASGGGTNSTTADPKQACAARGWTYTSNGSCIAPLVATAAGASLGGSCLDGYFADSSGKCMPKGYDNGANIPTGKNLGPTSTSVDPCRVTPVPPSCIASGAVTVSANTVVQAQTARYGAPAAPSEGSPAPGGGGSGGASQSSPPPSGSASSQFTAPPAKGGKAAAPVLIFNVLGADNKALTDSNGKELTTKPAVKSGNTVFVDKSGSPVITAPTLDPSGRPVTGPDGNVLYTKLMTYAGQEAVTDSAGRAVTASPLLNGSGKALQASNGRVVYAPPVLDVKGNIILNAYGSPILAQPLSDATGAIAVSPNGEPIVVQPMVAEGGKAILKNGQPVYVGAAGGQAFTAKNEPIKTAFGQAVTFSNSGVLADEGGNAVLGPDGRPVILSAAGVPIAANGSALLDRNGKPIRVSANGGVTDSSGRPILGADNKQIVLGAAEVATVLKAGKNVIKSTDGKQVTVALNGQLVDASGNPILTASNKPIFIDPKTKTFKDSSGNTVAVSKTGVLSAKSSPLTFQTGALDAA